MTAAESKLPTRCEGNGANSKVLPFGLPYQDCYLVKTTLTGVPSSSSSVIPDPVEMKRLNSPRNRIQTGPSVRGEAKTSGFLILTHIGSSSFLALVVSCNGAAPSEVGTILLAHCSLAFLVCTPHQMAPSSSVTFFVTLNTHTQHKVHLRMVWF